MVRKKKFCAIRIIRSGLLSKKKKSHDHGSSLLVLQTLNLVLSPCYTFSLTDLDACSGKQGGNPHSTCAILAGQVDEVSFLSSQNNFEFVVIAGSLV